MYPLIKCACCSAYKFRFIKCRDLDLEEKTFQSVISNV